MDHRDAVAALEALSPGETFTTTGILTATKRDGAGFDIAQSGIPIGGAPSADLAAQSINPASRPRSR